MSQFSEVEETSEPTNALEGAESDWESIFEDDSLSQPEQCNEVASSSEQEGRLQVVYEYNFVYLLILSGYLGLEFWDEVTLKLTMM